MVEGGLDVFDGQALYQVQEVLLPGCRVDRLDGLRTLSRPEKGDEGKQRERCEAQPAVAMGLSD